MDPEDFTHYIFGTDGSINHKPRGRTCGWSVRALNFESFKTVMLIVGIHDKGCQ